MTNLAWQIHQHVYCGSVLRSDNFNTPIDCQHLAVRRQQGRGNASNMAIHVDHAGMGVDPYTKYRSIRAKPLRKETRKAVQGFKSVNPCSLVVIR
jgi:hypothetical protein